jgi:hypothetical protein
MHLANQGEIERERGTPPLTCRGGSKEAQNGGPYLWYIYTFYIKLVSGLNFSYISGHFTWQTLIILLSSYFDVIPQTWR